VQPDDLPRWLEPVSEARPVAHARGVRLGGGLSIGHEPTVGDEGELTSGVRARVSRAPQEVPALACVRTGTARGGKERERGGKERERGGDREQGRTSS